MDFTIYANKYRNEIIKTTQELVQIPSIEGDPQEGMPMGAEVDKALRYVLDICQNMGFRTKNLDGYVGYAEYGHGPEMVGILGHLDVVPAGEGWTKPPFGGVVDRDRLYGRGTTDNKGPTVSAIYALKAVKEAKVPLKRRVRLIFGTNEESGWRGIRYYTQNEETPTMAFVPDASYPVINVEKGIVHVHLTHKATDNKVSGGKTLQVLELAGGHRANMIPRLCTCTLAGEEDTLKQAAEIAQSLQGDPYPQVSAIVKGDKLVLTMEGLAGHGSTPNAGVNAISYMMQALKAMKDANLTFESQAVDETIDFLTQHVGLETNGKSLGIDYEDDVSGALTLNVGLIDYEEGQVSIAFDIRYPVTKKEEDILNPIRTAASKYNLTITQGHSNHSLHVPEDGFLVQQLLNVYEKHTGERPRPLSIGGGTYARAFDNAVAFGSTMPGEERNVHREDEFTTITDLLRNAAIFADAIVMLAGK